MSTFVPATVACPACGETADVQLATSLNVTRTPAHRSSVLDDDFQRVRCERCGTETVHMLDMLYIDFDAKLFVGALRPEVQRTWADVEHEIEESFVRALGADAPVHAQRIGAGFVIRTVFGLPALREKIVARSLGVSDVDIEILKLRLAFDDGQPNIGLDDLPRLVTLDGNELVLRPREGPDVRVPVVWLDDTTDSDLESARDALAAGPWVDAGRLLGSAPTRPSGRR